MKKKLTSQRAFSMMELLIAVAVLSILCASLGLVLPATLQSYQDVTRGSEAAVLCSTLSEAVAEELRYATSCGQLAGALTIVDSSGNTSLPMNTTKTLAYDSQRFGPSVELGAEKEDDTVRLIVTRETKKYPLVSVKAYSKGLTVGYFALTSKEGIYNVKLQIIAPAPDPTEPPEQIASANFTVARLNE